MKYKYSVLNTSRWESSTIVEWLLYYREIGFEHVYIYCNDDKPDEMYQTLLPFVSGSTPFVTFHHLPYQGQQEYCWLHFLEHHKHETEWFMFVDADEFLAIKGSNSVHEFMRHRQNRWDCIHFNWIWFGPQEFVERPRGSTLLQFTRREDHRLQMNYFTKTMNRSALIDVKMIERPPPPAMLNHFWPAAIDEVLRSANVLDYPFAEYRKDHPRASESYLAIPGVREALVDTACTYHYLFRSRADFKRRIERGLSGAYWFQTQWGERAESPDFEGYLATLHAYEDMYLKDFWHAFLGRATETSLVMPSHYENLALGSTPSQSSTSEWSNHSDPSLDAKGAIDGRLTGGDGFHTDQEEGPWWMTDLGRACRIFELRLFNSLKATVTAKRAYHLAIDVSDDGESWNNLLTKDDERPFGGVDGDPFILPLPAGPSARFVKLRLLRKDFFHLDQVEIYGIRT